MRHKGHRDLSMDMGCLAMFLLFSVVGFVCLVALVHHILKDGGL